MLKNGWQLLIFLSLHHISQSQLPWKGKQCAVVLTYDDAIDQHLDHALPVLDSLSLKASFYITASSSSVHNRLNEWKALAQHGHELGNHSLYHPCDGNLPGRSFVKPETDLQHYTVKGIENELRMTNTFLQALDGQQERTFAFTCGDMKVADSFFIKGMKSDFIAARAVRNEMHPIEKVDLYNIDCYMVNHHRFEEMKQWVENAIQQKALLVILFHGVGGGNGLDVSLEDHRAFLQYLHDQTSKIWVAPLIDVSKYIIQQRK